MANSAKNTKGSKSNRTEARTENRKPGSGAGAEVAETLYQRLGDRWYAFSLIDDQVFVGSISADDAKAGNLKEIKAFKITGQS